MDSVTRRVIRESLPVQRALELGWKHCESNRKALKYFRFEGPGRFEAAAINGRIIFTVGNETDTYVPAVIKRSEALATADERTSDPNPQTASIQTQEDIDRELLRNVELEAGIRRLRK